MDEGVYIIIDTETTGLWPGKNGLIEFAAAILDKNLNILKTLNFDICPPESAVVEEESLRITGFTKQRIIKGLTYSQAVDKIYEFISNNFTSSSPIFVGQFYPFDYAFIVDLFVSTSNKKKLERFMTNKFIDTKSFVTMLNLRAKLKNKEEPFPSTSLSSEGGLKDRLGIPKDTYQSHTAMGDVLATHAILLHLTQLSDI